jgi:hypothetical protein
LLCLSAELDATAAASSMAGFNPLDDIEGCGASAADAGAVEW